MNKSYEDNTHFIKFVRNNEMVYEMCVDLTLISQARKQSPECEPPDPGHTPVAEPCWSWGSLDVLCLGYEQISPFSYDVGWKASWVSGGLCV